MTGQATDTGSAAQYEFIKLLGRGGMAEVFLCHKFAPSGGFKEVAYKRMLPHMMSDPSRVSKFMDEIAVAASLVHPNIVGVAHWGTYEGDYFIELELVRGLNLMELIEALAPEGEQYGRLPVALVALLGVHMLEALDYAHNFERASTNGQHITGVVHRDISPDNVMLTLRGSAKVNDWGIAKGLKGEEQVASKTVTAAGKPYYHPREQWEGGKHEGREVDARTDLYAVGTTLALALCGRQLFPSRPGEQFASLVHRVFMGDRPPVAELVPPGTPPALTELLEKMVQVNRDDRPASAKELIRPFKDIVRELVGDLDTAKEQLAELVKAHYGGDSDTHRALQPPSMDTGDLPSRSSRRRIDPETRREGAEPTTGAGLTANARPQAGQAQTAALAPGAVPPVYQAHPSQPGPITGHSGAYTAPQAPSGARPALWAALGGGVVLLAVLSAVAGFVFSNATQAPPDETSTTVAAEESAPPAAGDTRAASDPATAESATVSNEPGAEAEAAEPVAEVPAPVEAAPPAEEVTPPEAEDPAPVRRGRRAGRGTAPTPQVRPLGEQRPTPSRGRRRATTGDFGL